MPADITIFNTKFNTKDLDFKDFAIVLMDFNDRLGYAPSADAVHAQQVHQFEGDQALFSEAGAQARIRSIKLVYEFELFRLARQTNFNYLTHNTKLITGGAVQVPAILQVGVGSGASESKGKGVEPAATASSSKGKGVEPVGNASSSKSKEKQPAGASGSKGKQAYVEIDLEDQD